MRNAAKGDGGFDLNGLEPGWAEDPNEEGGPASTGGNGAPAGPDGGGQAADTGGAPDLGATRLLDPADVASFREQWSGVQGGFVDDPRRTVEQADYLVDLVLSKLTEDLRQERAQLVRRWDRGAEDVSTEELRQALREYRTLLERLLSL